MTGVITWVVTEDHIWSCGQEVRLKEGLVWIDWLSLNICLWNRSLVYDCHGRDVGIQTMSDWKPKKAFECEECDKSYSKRQYVRDHMLTVHRKSQVNYSCRVCGQGCGWRVTLLKHIKKCHPEKNSSKMIDILY